MCGYQDVPEKIMKYLVLQFAKVLPSNPEARKSFVQSECLRTILSIKAEEGSKLKENIQFIINCFPQNVIQYYSPDHAKELLKQLDEPATKP